MSNLSIFPAVLESSEVLGPQVKHFTFRLPTRESFNFIPGQFITIHFEKEGKVHRRSYSIANPPDGSNCISFAAGFVPNGVASEILFALKPGDTLNIAGAFGRLILQETTPKRYIFLSTSTGVTPFRAMLPVLKERLAVNPELQIILFEGVRRREDALYVQEFLDFQKEVGDDKFQFYACFSREESALETHEKAGYVQTHLENLNINPAGDVVYLCGNPGMIDAAFEALKARELDVRNILREKYISSK